MNDADHAVLGSRAVSSSLQRLMLVPLRDAVHFPRTELRLRVTEPEYCRFFEQACAPGEELWIGTVLLEPEIRSAPLPPVFDAGTASRLVDYQVSDEGCEIVLRGEFRFAVDREEAGGPCRRAWVRRLDEADLSELDPDVQSLRQELLRRTICLASELGGRFDLGPGELRQLQAALPFEAMVNHLAANMDVAPRRKLQLLRDELPARALHLLTILRGRQQILDALRPFRHLAAAAERN